MKKTWILAAAAVCGTLTVVGPAQAQQDGQRGGKGGPRGIPFEKMDANGDGEVTFDEFSQAQMRMIEKRFERLDANGDGVLTEEEMKNARSRGRGQNGARKGKGGGSGPPEESGD